MYSWSFLNKNIRLQLPLPHTHIERDTAFCYRDYRITLQVCPTLT